MIFDIIKLKTISFAPKLLLIKFISVMNKKLLLSLIIMLFVGLTASAQPISLTHEGQPVENGQTFECTGLLEEHICAIEVTNTSDRAVNIICEREDISVVPETINFFCWGLCFSPTIFISPAYTLEGGASTEFSGHYMAMELSGTTTVRYSFYEESNTAEKFVITINYSYSGVSVADFNDTKIFSNAYPSPAKDQVNFKYDMPSSVNSAKIVLFNMMGQEVKSQDIMGHFGTLTLSVSDLSEGIYFYSLVINNNTQKTSKLVISR